MRAATSELVPPITPVRQTTKPEGEAFLLVRWTLEGDEPHTEETSTIAVNAHGTLIALGFRVKPGNNSFCEMGEQSRKRNSKLGTSGQSRAQKGEIGIAMLMPDARFWGVQFTPEDGKPYL